MNPPPPCPRCGAVRSTADEDGPCPNCLADARRPASPAAPGGPLADDLAGERLGDYEIRALIARGGMGRVYRARQISLNREVALKMITIGSLAGGPERDRFRREAEAVAQLEHPNIIPVYEVNEVDGQPFFTMRLVDGGSLADRVTVPGTQRTSEQRQGLVRLMIKVARAVGYAHQCGILHRDLKPANILLDAAGEPFVADFGLAKRLDGPRLTATGDHFGTPHYMSPEQAAGPAKLLTTATDIYSLGAILYELLTGQPPFPGETTAMVLRRIEFEEPTRPRVLVPALERDLETICLKCLEKKSTGRYATAGALAEDLERWLRGEPILARQTQPWERAIKWARRRPALAALLMVSVLAAAILIALQWTHNRSNQTNLYVAQMFRGFVGVEQEDLGPARAVLAVKRPAGLRGFEWRLLHALCQSEEVATLAGPGEEVNCLAFSPDGEVLAQGGWRKPALLWDWKKREYLGTIPSADLTPREIDAQLGSLLMKNPLLLAADAAAGRNVNEVKMRVHPTESGYVTSLAFSPDGELLATGETDRYTKIWSVRERKLVNMLTEVDARVVFVPGTNWLIAGLHPAPDGDQPALVRCYQYAAGPPLKSLQTFTNANGYFALHPNQPRIALAAPDGPVSWHELSTGRLGRSFPFHGHAIGLAWSPDGRRLAVIDAAVPGVTVWDADSGEPLAEFATGLGRILRLAFSPDGQRLLTAGADHTVRLWEVNNGAALAVWRGHDADVQDVAFTPDGRWAVSASKDKTVRFWDATKRLADEGLSEARRPVCVTPDGHALIGKDASGNWQRWDFATRASQPLRDVETNDVVLGFLPGGREMVCARPGRRGRTSSLQLVNPIDGAQITNVLTFTNLTLRGAVLSPDGQTITTLQNPGKIVVLETVSGRLLHSADWSNAVYAASLSFTPDGRGLLAVRARERATFFATTNLQQRWDLTDVRPASWAFSPDGVTLALGEEDNWITLVDTASGRQRARLTGHRQRISAVAFTTDGRTLVSAGGEGTLKFWHLDTLKEVASWSRPGRCAFLHFLPGDAALCTAGGEGGARLWPGPTLAEADEQARRGNPKQISPNFPDGITK